MGCDIHLFTEYKRDGKWFAAEPWVEKEEYGEKELKVPYHLRPFAARDYDFFGWLADVRNGTWGEPLPVIAAPRGIPGDVCEQIKQCSEYWDADGHSHSWLTLTELEAAWEKDKEYKIKFHGALDPRKPSAELAAWLAKPEETRGAPPGGFCASGGGNGYSYPHFVWYKALKDEVGESYRKLEHYLWTVGIEYSAGHDEVRAVFWFDN